MSIKSKLVLVFVSVLTGLVGIFAVNYVGGLYVVKTRELTALANDGAALFLQARRHEKNFLLRKEEQYTARALENAEESARILEEIGRRKPGLAESCRSALELLKRYEDALSRVNRLSVEMGLTMKDGLRWAFIQAARNMEAEFSRAEMSTDFVIKLLQMRRHEKNYIIRGDEQYVGRVDKGVEELRGLLASGYSPEESSGALNGLKGYQDAFHTYVGKEKEIAGLTAGLVEAARSLEPVWARIADSSAAQSRSDEQLIDYIVVGVELTVGVTILLLLLWVLRSINDPLVRLNAYARTVAEGRLDVEPQGRFVAELGELKGVLVNMVANLRAVIGEARAM